MITDNAISLITAVRNDAGHLPSTLQSVLRQTTTPARHVIVDGCSSDGSLEIACRYARKAPYEVVIVSTPPAGIYDALNHGIQAIEGGLVGMLHCGDRLASAEVLGKVARAFGHLMAPVLYADIKYMGSNGRITRSFRADRFRTPLLRWGYMFPHTSMFVSREVFDQYGMYDTAYTISADFEWGVRVLLKAGVESAYLPLLTTYMSAGGISSKWRHRLLTSPHEKIKALRANGFDAKPWHILGRYKYLLGNK